MQNKNVEIVSDGYASFVILIGMNRREECAMKNIHVQLIVPGRQKLLINYLNLNITRKWKYQIDDAVLNVLNVVRTIKNASITLANVAIHFVLFVSNPRKNVSVILNQHIIDHVAQLHSNHIPFFHGYVQMDKIYY
jgi:hypothetical protein